MCVTNYRPCSVTRGKGDTHTVGLCPHGTQIRAQLAAGDILNIVFVESVGRMNQ